MSERIERALANGAAKWPGIKLDAPAFTERVLAAETHVGGDLDEARLADLYLATACSAGDASALAAFEAAYFGDLRAALSRVDRNAAFQDEALQQLRLRLFVAGDDGRCRVDQYRGRGDLYSWTRVVAVRLAIDIKRQGGGQAASVDLADAQADDIASDPLLEQLKEKYAAEFRDAVTSALAALEKRQRTLLRLIVIDRVSVDALAKMRGVHRTTISRQLREVRERVGELTRDRMRTSLSLAAHSTELESVFRLIASRLDVSIRAHLGDD